MAFYLREIAQGQAMTAWWLAYPVLGIFGGFCAGLFGVGGGMVLVPLLFMLFGAQGFPVEHMMHLALGTSMATIALTSLSSMRAHHAHGAVRWDIFRSMAPGLLLGTLCGSLFVSGIPTRPLAMAFTIIVFCASGQMMLDLKPQPHRQLPGPPGLFAVGTGIGVLSSIVAAGGGFVSVPFMVFCNVVMHKAVGTSSALGFPIAVAGLVGYVASGWNVTALPPYTLGYVYLPGLLGVVAMSMLVAPIGARLAHRLPVRQLKRAFGGLLAVLAIKMLLGLLYS
jgi:uncharacterized membrane protein YfcA